MLRKLMLAAQDAGTTTPAASPDRVVEALERQKKIAELKKAIAEAEKAVLAAGQPTTEASGNTGAVTFGDGSGYYAEILAYEAMTTSAVNMVLEIGAPPAGKGQEILVVSDENFVKSAPLWDIASNRIQDAIDKISDLLNNQFQAGHDFSQPEGVAAALTTVSGILGAAADIASFFRTELTVKARTVNVSATSAVAAVAASLKNQGWQPVLPSASLAKPTILTKVEELQQSRLALAQRRRDLLETVRERLEKFDEVSAQLKEAEEALKEACAANPKVPGDITAAEARVRSLQAQIIPLGTIKGRWESAKAEIDATLSATDVLIKALLEAPDGKPSPIEVLAAIDRAKAKPSVLILRLEISSQGGEIHVSKSVWSTRLTYVGGVAMSFLLTDQDGKLLKSGVFALPVARSTRPGKAAGTLPIDVRSAAIIDAAGQK